MKLSLSLLDKDGYITLNKSIMRYLGIDAAILFGELFSEFIYYYNNHMLTEDGFFFSKAENIEENTTLSAYKQREALKVLKEKNFVVVDLRGVPAKNYFSINLEAVDEFLNSDVKNFNNLILNAPRDENILQPDVKNFNISYNNNTDKERLNKCIALENKKENKQINIKDLPPLKALEVYKEEFNLSDEIFESFKDYLDMRKKNGDKLNSNIVKRAIMKLQSLSSDPGEQLEIINQSIIGCWSGLFPLKQTRPPQRYYQQPQREPEHEEENVIERLRKKYKAIEEAEKQDSGLLSEE